MDISIVIPAMNEEGNVGLLYKKIASALKPVTKKFEIIYVDDGSTDSTPEILEIS